jgi:hypothetical protein
MADPICRWRNPYLYNVVELITCLPKTELPKKEARELVNKRFGKEFFGAPYQLACQLGLYYENEYFFFPKFKHEPTEEEVQNYLVNWVKHYCVPNPYTKKGFKDVSSFSIHGQLCEKLFRLQRNIKWEEIDFELFGEEIGNFDILRNSINTYSDVIRINGKLITLKDGVFYSELENYIKVDISIDRNDKEYFFDLFSISKQIESENVENAMGFELFHGELEQLKEIETNSNLSLTEKVQLSISRIGQGLFRRNLITECICCPITGVDDPRLLIASHIKPWRVANNQERLYEKNGLLLSPTYDKLFDQGFISFNSNKNLIVSNEVSLLNRKRLHLIDNIKIPLLPIEGREMYLEYHRDELFRR